MSQRITSLQEKMKAENIDALMVQSRPNVYYVSGFDTDPHERLVASVIFRDQEPLLICPQMEVNQVKDVFTDGKIIGYTDTEDPWEKISNYFNEIKVTVSKIALENNIPWSRLKEWQKITGGGEFVEADSYLNSLRLIKSSEEIKFLREAAQLADDGIRAGISALQEGVTEMEVLASIEYALKKKGVREMSFSTMVLFGESGGDPHGNPGHRQLKKGDSVLFDLGAVWKGYSSDITRTVFFDHADEEHIKVYETVLAAQKKSLEACRPGAPASELDKAARIHIENAGYGEYFPHRIGHGLGIEVHEFPSLSGNNNSPLEEGMTFTIEPGIYIPGKLGVRIEDDVLITADGYETLTLFPKELTIVPS